MDSPQFPSPGRSGAWQPPSPEELQQQLPQYKVLDLLGQGGMGAVYKGWQVSLERYVAIKILPPDADEGDSHFTARFKQEAKTMAKFMHPGIVAVFDTGETASGLLYIVMEMVEGTDVAQMVKTQGRLAPENALAISINVCDALTYAHERRVIHRDIKPANIMVNLEGQVKVADFGLAMGANVGNRGLTRSDVSLGTPDYIAPEALITGIVVDHRADLYAVGVMLYDMLTGEIPRGHFKVPSVKAGTDPRFDAIVLKAMEPEREQRYQSAAEIRRDLDVIHSTPLTRPVEGAPPQQESPAPKPVKRATTSQRPPPKKSSNGMAAAVVGTVTVLGIAAFFVFKKPSRSGDTPVVESSSSAMTTGVSSLLANATKAAPFVNTLGMKFVPVPGTQVLFSIWDTRVQDYAAYAAANKNLDGSWKTQSYDGVPVGRELDHPVVGVSWDDAQAFCQWLTDKEIAEGKLPQGMKYRLPTDEEWSRAVGLPPEPGTTPAQKNGKNSVDFPWGKEWPPKGKVGNYADEVFHAKFPPKKNEKVNRTENHWIDGYNDGYATTSPVGSFPANAYGLYDMGGNVWQSCEDWYDATHKGRVLRGASWRSGDRSSRLSSNRYYLVPTARDLTHGFRCVLEPAPAATSATTAPVPASGAPALPSATKDAPFVNTLGMKFVPVPGTKVLFSIWETRVQDYAAFAKAKTVNDRWTKQEKDGVPVSRSPTRPVVGVNWDDANAFCQWITEKETAEGGLPKGGKYRLPTDEEWSLAVGLASEQDTTPAEKDQKNQLEYPWGRGFPPPEAKVGIHHECVTLSFPRRMRKAESCAVVGNPAPISWTSSNTQRQSLFSSPKCIGQRARLMP